MEITQSKAKNLVVKITIKLQKEDYIDKVDSILKDYRKTVSVQISKRKNSYDYSTKNTDVLCLLMK